MNRGPESLSFLEKLDVFDVDHVVKTTFKMSRNSFSYGDKTYNLMQFGLSKSGYIHCFFDRVDEDEFHSLFEEDDSEENDYQCAHANLIHQN